VVASLDEEQRLATPGMCFHLGVKALADRDFSQAAYYFEAEQDKTLMSSLVFYRAYALCLAGQREPAQELLRGNMDLLVNKFGKRHVTWLRDTFGLNLPL